MKKTPSRLSRSVRTALSSVRSSSVRLKRPPPNADIEEKKSGPNKNSSATESVKPSGSGSDGSTASLLSIIVEGFAIPRGHVLTPRADVWIYLSCSTTVSIGFMSIASMLDSAMEFWTLAALLIQLVLAVVVSLLMRYRISCDCITSEDYLRSMQSSFPFTYETWFSLLALSLQLFIASVIFRSKYTLGVMLGSCWSTSLYFATWVSSGLSAYLVAELLTVEDSRGLIRAGHCPQRNQVQRSYVLLFISSVALLAFSLDLRMECSAGTQSEPNACNMTTMGCVNGVAGMFISALYFGIVYLVSNKENSSLQPRSVKRFTSFLAVTVLACFSLNASSLTQSVSEYEVHISLYVNSWVCFIISLAICLRQLDALFPSYSDMDETKEAKPRRDRDRSQSNDSTAPTSDASSICFSIRSFESSKKELIEAHLDGEFFEIVPVDEGNSTKSNVTRKSSRSNSKTKKQKETKPIDLIEERGGDSSPLPIEKVDQHLVRDPSPIGSNRAKIEPSGSHGGSSRYVSTDRSSSSGSRKSRRQRRESIDVKVQAAYSSSSSASRCSTSRERTRSDLRATNYISHHSKQKSVRTRQSSLSGGQRSRRGGRDKRVNPDESTIKTDMDEAQNGAQVVLPDTVDAGYTKASSKATSHRSSKSPNAKRSGAHPTADSKTAKSVEGDQSNYTPLDDMNGELRGGDYYKVNSKTSRLSSKSPSAKVARPTADGNTFNKPKLPSFVSRASNKVDQTTQAEHDIVVLVVNSVSSPISEVTTPATLREHSLLTNPGVPVATDTAITSAVDFAKRRANHDNTHFRNNEILTRVLDDHHDRLGGQVAAKVNHVNQITSQSLLHPTQAPQSLFRTKGQHKGQENLMNELCGLMEEMESYLSAPPISVPTERRSASKAFEMSNELHGVIGEMEDYLTATPISTPAETSVESATRPVSDWTGSIRSHSDSDLSRFEDLYPLSTPIADLNEVRECVEQLAGHELPSRSSRSGGRSSSFSNSYELSKGSSLCSTRTSKASNSTASTGRRQREHYFKNFSVLFREDYLTASPISTPAETSVESATRPVSDWTGSIRSHSDSDLSRFEDLYPLSTPIADLNEVRECVEQLAGHEPPSRSSGSGGRSSSFSNSYELSSLCSTRTSKASNSTASTGRRQREHYFNNFGVGRMCMVCSSPGKESVSEDRCGTSPRYSINTEEPSDYSLTSRSLISRLSLNRSSTSTTSSGYHQGSPVFAC